MIERMTDPSEQEEDRLPSLRPERLSDFIGQESIKENMSVYIRAARMRKESLDHVLLSGPPGLGKTTFAHIISREMNANLRSTSAPVIEKSGDMAALLTSIKEGEVLFIDEIHRLKPVIEEVLYSAMEDFILDIQLGQGSTAKTVKINLPPFTLVGATTKAGSLSQPLISRFGIVNHFSFYGPEDLMQIARRNAGLFKADIDETGLHEISRRSRGTPRILNRILRRVRDFAQVEGKGRVNEGHADWALGRMHIDKMGFDDLDRRLLEVLIRNFSGGPVGLENLATSLGEDAGTLEDMVEPYLIQTGFVKRTHRGRVATAAAWKHLGLQSANQTLFDTDPSL